MTYIWPFLLGVCVAGLWNIAVPEWSLLRRAAATLASAGAIVAFLHMVRA